MFTPLLAQAAVDANTTEGTAAAIAGLFDRLDMLAQPTELVEKLQQLPVVMAAMFVAVGLVCLLQGFRLYKAVVLLIALITGVTVGYNLGHHVQAEVIVSCCLGVLLAVVAWPLMKYAVAVAGGLAGAFIGANAWTGFVAQMSDLGFTLNAQTPWIGALFGLLTLGLLSFILFELAVILFTSFSGATLAVLGIIALLLQIDALREGITNGLADKPMIIPMLVVVPAVIGLVLQQQLGGFKKLHDAGGAPAGAKPDPA